ncbi:MAG: hypothetical protein GF398_01500, partial [Chitinivibrionales bacterium]|nr:hypothetical protein [Chitinivibrionales bacterium]
MIFVSGIFLYAVSAMHIEWTPLHEPGSGGRLTSIAVSPYDGNHVMLGGDMLGIGVSFDKGDSWLPTFGLPSWEIGDFTFHPENPDIVWAATMSGPCKSTDKGVTWASKRNGMPDIAGYHYSVPLQKILFDPSDVNRRLAFGGSHRHWHESDDAPEFGAIWESTGSGETWGYVTTLGGTRYNGKNIMNATFAGLSSDTLWAAVYGDGVYISTNGGGSWSKRHNGLAFVNPAWVESHPSNSRIAWLAMDNYLPQGASELLPGRIYTTTDAGENWSSVSSGLPNIVTGTDKNRTARYEIVRVAQTNPDILFTSNTSWPEAGLFLSLNGANSWSETALSVEKAYVSGPSMEFACFDPNDDNVIFAANASYVLRTTDGGGTWTDATSYIPDGKTNWRGRGFSGLVAKKYRFHPTNPAISALTAMDHGNFWLSTDTMHTWRWGGENFPNFGGGNDIAFAGDNTVYVNLGQSSSFKGIAKSSDLGLTWSILDGNGLPQTSGSGSKSSSVFALADNPGRVWAVVNQTLYYSSNGGGSWQTAFNSAKVNVLEASSPTSPVLYLGTDNGLYKGGSSGNFNRISGGPAEVTNCAPDPRHPDTVYVCAWRKNDGGLWRYDGSTWEQLRDDEYIRSAAVHPEDESILVYTTDDHPYHDVSYATGVYFSENYGQTWTQENTGLA